MNTQGKSKHNLLVSRLTEELIGLGHQILPRPKFKRSGSNAGRYAVDIISTFDDRSFAYHVKPKLDASNFHSAVGQLLNVLSFYPTAQLCLVSPQKPLKEQLAVMDRHRILFKKVRAVGKKFAPKRTLKIATGFVTLHGKGSLKDTVRIQRIENGSVTGELVVFKPSGNAQPVGVRGSDIRLIIEFMTGSVVEFATMIGYTRITVSRTIYRRSKNSVIQRHLSEFTAIPYEWLWGDDISDPENSSNYYKVYDPVRPTP